MKKKIIVLILVFMLFCQNIGANESLFFESNVYVYSSIHNLMEVSFRFFFPPNDDSNFSFINIGYGWNFDIINNILSPGILFDLSIGTDWIALFNPEYETSDPLQIGLGFGIKFNNLIEMGEFKIIPFAGCNFLVLYKICPMFGLSLSFKYFGLEYAYYFPIGSYKPEDNHHISIKFIAKNFNF
jgi:hypothetical protein